jgi:hypothetical protein
MNTVQEHNIIRNINVYLLQILVLIRQNASKVYGTVYSNRYQLYCKCTIYEYSTVKYELVFNIQTCVLDLPMRSSDVRDSSAIYTSSLSLYLPLSFTSSSFNIQRCVPIANACL